MNTRRSGKNWSFSSWETAVRCANQRARWSGERQRVYRLDLPMGGSVVVTWLVSPRGEPR